MYRYYDVNAIIINLLMSAAQARVIESCTEGSHYGFPRIPVSVYVN